VQANPDISWNWYILSSNPSFFTFPTSEMVIHIRKYIAASTIYRTFKEAYTNPAYALCHKRLYREFESMSMANESISSR